MKLLTRSIRNRLLANGRKQKPLRGSVDEIDFRPVVKLFIPDAACIWLLTELDPENPDIAFGLCDLGRGTTAIGAVRLSELERVNGPTGRKVARDRHFRAQKSLIAYTVEALEFRSIQA